VSAATSVSAATAAPGISGAGQRQRDGADDRRRQGERA